MTTLRIAQVNREIAKRWPGVELVKGKGYYYLIGKSLERAPTTSILVYSLNQLTLAQWMDHIEIVMTDAHR